MFFNDPATTEIYTLSLHDALPICEAAVDAQDAERAQPGEATPRGEADGRRPAERRLDPGWIRSEEHTSELQSRQYLVCRLLLEKKTAAAISEEHTSELQSRHYLVC